MTENDNISPRPLGVVKEIIEELGAEISYAYDDLMFIKHNHFLLQFGDTPESLFFFKNSEVEKAESEQQFTTLATAAEAKQLNVIFQGEYNLTENDDGTISIEFLEKKTE